MSVRFLDKGQSKTVLAEGINDAYEDLFSLNINAHRMNKEEVKNKLKVLLQGNKSDDVFKKMASTFKALSNLADFDTKRENAMVSAGTTSNYNDDGTYDPEEMYSNGGVKEVIKKSIVTEMHYNIQIHLPDTKDIEVYNAIFKALKTHLL